MSVMVEAEASQQIIDELLAYDTMYGDADSALDSLLTPAQSHVWHRTGLYPLSVLRRQMLDNSMVTGIVETWNALLRSGTTDTDRDYEIHGSSAPLGDWEARGQFYPGHSKGPRYVRVPWKWSIDEQDEAWNDHYIRIDTESKEYNMTTAAVKATAGKAKTLTAVKDVDPSTLTAVNRSQGARNHAIAALIALHPEDWKECRKAGREAFGIKDHTEAREAKERAEFERLAAKYGTEVKSEA